MWKEVFLLGLCLLCVYATSNLPGGFQVVNPYDEDVVTAAHEITRIIFRYNHDDYYSKIAKIIKAKKKFQTTGRDAGMQYQLDLVYGTTKCEQEEEKIDYEKIQDCEFQDETDTFRRCFIEGLRDLKDNYRYLSIGCGPFSKEDL